MCHVSSEFPASAIDSLIFDINSQGDSKLIYVALYHAFGYQNIIGLKITLRKDTI